MTVAADLKSLFQVTRKKRFDSITDQYQRIFMVKLLLACSLITGLAWYGDKINCVNPDNSDERVSSFISPTCWIQGLYVYKQLRTRFDAVAYYGLPKDLAQDGLVEGFLCRTENKFNLKNGACKPMERTYYLQYQWLPFYVCALTLMYYIPYLLFNAVNQDLFTLKNDIKAEDVTATKIIKGYFSEMHSLKKRGKFTIRQVLNVAIKLTYLAANVLAFIGTDSLLEGEFRNYGVQWVKWSSKPNTIKFDYKGLRDFPKPGNELFPPFGLCDIYASSSDKKSSFGDEHTVLCEMSQHILFQYTFMVIWFAIVIGIGVSAIGVIMQIALYVIGVGIRHSRYKMLNFRQREYLEYIHLKNRPLYKEVIEELNERYPKPPEKNGNVNMNGCDENDKLYNRPQETLNLRV